MALGINQKRPDVSKFGHARDILARCESASSDPFLATMVRDQIRHTTDERDRLASKFHQVSEPHHQESFPMPKILDAFLTKIPADIQALDDQIAGELRQARTSKYIEDAKVAAERAQELISECKKSPHPLGQCIATTRQADINAILNAPWVPGVLFKGSLLCLKNNPGDPWDGYQPTDGERADIQGQIPWENRKGLRLRHPRRQLSGPTIIQPRY